MDGNRDKRRCNALECTSLNALTVAWVLLIHRRQRRMNGLETPLFFLSLPLLCTNGGSIYLLLLH